MGTQEQSVSAFFLSPRFVEWVKPAGFTHPQHLLCEQAKPKHGSRKTISASAPAKKRKIPTASAGLRELLRKLSPENLHASGNIVTLP
ncbi:MAG: hypothetical protein ACRERR_00120 [Moraxellaceae bacterium]